MKKRKKQIIRGWILILLLPLVYLLQLLSSRVVVLYTNHLLEMELQHGGQIEMQSEWWIIDSWNLCQSGSGCKMDVYEMLWLKAENNEAEDASNIILRVHSIRSTVAVVFFWMYPLACIGFLVGIILLIVWYRNKKYEEKTEASLADKI